MKIIAVDPGNVTGVAVAEFVGRDFESLSAFEVTPFRAIKFVEEDIRDGKTMEEQPVGLVACESFTPRPGVRTWQPDALYTIGALKYICQRDGIPFALQSPADAKKFSTDEKLKNIGWYDRTTGGHKNDALRHLLLAAVRNDELKIGALL